MSDGHFVKFFAPSNLSPLPKNIVFVIDVSGSMWGVKMKQVGLTLPTRKKTKHCHHVVTLQNAFNSKFLLPQTVEAMQAILDDLTMDDHFSIVDFNHNVRCWSEELVHGSSIQVADAKAYIKNIKPNGGERGITGERKSRSFFWFGADISLTPLTPMQAPTSTRR